jgi:hypothetical protein
MLVVQWSLLALLAMLLLVVGGMWLIRRLGRSPLRRPRKLRRRYFSSIKESHGPADEPAGGDDPADGP